MITIILAIVFIIVLVLGHEFGHFLAAKLSGMRVDEFGFGFPPRIWGKKKGETLYSVNAFPFGGFVKIYGEDEVGEKELSPEEKKRNFLYQPAYKKAIVLTAGVLMNFLIGWLALTAVFMIGIPQSVVVTGVIKGSPAAAAGIKAGDEILGFSNVSEFINYVSDSSAGGKSVAVKLLTNSKEETLSVTPKGGHLGVYIVQGGIPSEGFFQSVWDAMKSAGNIFGMIFYSVYQMIASAFAGHYGTLSEVTGPVGIYNILALSTKMGAAYVLQLLALISINLAAINIIPFPALDGGRLFFLAFNGLFRGKPNYKIEAVANTIGFALLFALMIAITVKDVINVH